MMYVLIENKFQSKLILNENLMMYVLIENKYRNIGQSEFFESQKLLQHQNKYNFYFHV